MVGLKNRGHIRGRTNNPASRDGMESGMIVFNELHQYQDYKNIEVFETGKGKKKHPRSLYATTDGEIREGPLDNYLERSMQILNGEIEDNGFLPFLCRLDSKDEAKDPAMWQKANPSLIYLSDLRKEIENEFKDWLESPETHTSFMTKRMNLPQSVSDIAVTAWENIAATNRELPDLTGESCTVGIDYASTGDMVSVNAHFRRGDIRYDINHSWLCLRSKDIPKMKAPWRDWANAGLLTVVDNVDINPELICDYIEDLGTRYNITKIALDNFRYTLIAKALEKIGFDAHTRKNVQLVRPADIMKIAPVILSCFANQTFVWGDNPVLRWATNNTKLVRAGKPQGTDTGNFYYSKIEGRSRKTDPFMALVASMIIEGDISTTEFSMAMFGTPVIC
jgi:phage terminase large subunit-like protein